MPSCIENRWPDGPTLGHVFATQAFGDIDNGIPYLYFRRPHYVTDSVKAGDPVGLTKDQMVEPGPLWTSRKWWPCRTVSLAVAS